jgi:penicillin-binding protein 2
MTVFRNVQVELARFRLRILVAAIVVLVCFVLVGARLFYLQVARHDDLLAQAENNRTAVVPIVPNRGLILDRNGIVLASNYSAYTLEVTPSRVSDLEKTIVDLSKVLDIAPRDRRRFKKLREEGKNFESIPLRSRLTGATGFRVWISRRACFATTPTANWPAT